MELIDPLAWAENVVGGAELGDIRRTRRLVALAASLAQYTGASIPTACGASAAAVEGAYRFARNDAVDPADIGAAGFAATVKAIKELEPKVLLAPEDTTTLSYDHDVDGLGDVGGPRASTTRGIWAHSAILLDAETERTLGLAAQYRWVRDADEYGKKHRRKELPYEKKESFKWQRTAEELRQRLGPQLMQRVISVCDREGDVFAYMANKTLHQERFIVRAEWNRNVTEQNQKRHLLEVLKAAPVCAEACVQLPQRGGRPARNATLSLRRAQVELMRPASLHGEYPARIQVNAVLAEELKPPQSEEPLSWMLLTTEPIATATEVNRILKFYRLRWRVEVFHKAWKTGAGVERKRLQSGKNLERIAVVLAFVAVRLLQLRELFQAPADVDCGELLDADTWKLLWLSVEKTKPPRTAPSAKWAYHAVARLAGWTDTKATGQVGWETLWKGWNRLQERLEGLRALQRLETFD